MDLRAELLAQYEHGPETYVGALCFKAAEEIRRLENELHDYRGAVSGVRASISHLKGLNDGNS